MKVLQKIFKMLLKPIIYYSLSFIVAFNIFFPIVIGFSFDTFIRAVKTGLLGGVLLGLFIGIFNWIMDLRLQKLQEKEK